MKHYPLVHSSWNRQEIESLQKVIRSGAFTMGSNVELFEKKFSGYLNKKFAVMVNSGSSANLLSISSLFYKKKKLIKGW